MTSLVVPTRYGKYLWLRNHAHDPHELGSLSSPALTWTAMKYIPIGVSVSESVGIAFVLLGTGVGAKEEVHTGTKRIGKGLGRTGLRMKSNYSEWSFRSYVR